MNYIQIISLTIVKDNIVKQSCPIANVSERVRYEHVAVGTSYENAVNNRCEKLGQERDFKAEPLKWGHWYIVNKVIAHNGNYYLRYYTDRNSHPSRTLWVGDRVATPTEVATINAHRKSSGSTYTNRQAERGIAAENQVQVRVANIANIIQFKCGEVIL